MFSKQAYPTLIYICGVKELNSPNPLHIEPKAHAKEEETPGNEQR